MIAAGIVAMIVIVTGIGAFASGYYAGWNEGQSDDFD